MQGEQQMAGRFRVLLEDPPLALALPGLQPRQQPAPQLPVGVGIDQSVAEVVGRRGHEVALGGRAVRVSPAGLLQQAEAR